LRLCVLGALLFKQEMGRVERKARGERHKAMTAASISLVEPDMRISLIRLSPRSTLPESIHNAFKPRCAK
jgi:hypothetical protein